MRTKVERRKFRRKKINQRKKIIKDTGYNGGLLYDRHIDKIKKSDGYLDTGNVMHYGRGSKWGEKTRDRNRYGKVTRWSYQDSKQIDSMEDELSEIAER